MRQFFLSLAVGVAAACGERQTPRTDSARDTIIPRVAANDSSSAAAEELDLGTEQFPLSRMLASLATGAPPATLSVSDGSCIPGKCRCSARFPDQWLLEHAGTNDREISACTVADFDGDGDWDASLPGGEGKSLMVFMQDARPHSVWYLDGGAVAELYPPRAQRGPNGEPAAKHYALLADNSLYEWRDSLFVRRTVRGR